MRRELTCTIGKAPFEVQVSKNGKDEENMRKKLISILLTVCMALTILPTTAFAAESLYKVVTDRGAPFRAEEDGSIVGNIPRGTILEVLDYDQGGYAKVKWNGYPVYVWADKLKSVDAPDVVCSEWAQSWINGMNGGYVGLKSEFPDVKNDYTKPITRLKMADMMIMMMVTLYSSEVRLSDYAVVLKGVEQPLTDTDDRYANYLARWGVVPRGRFRPNDIATYGEAVDTMIKLMAYDNRYNCTPEYGYSSPRTTVTKKLIDSLEIGGDTSANAPCTEEQLMVMYGKLSCWAKDYNLRQYAATAKANDPGKTSEGIFCIVSGTYTIQTALGEKGSHPYLNINADGHGELRGGAPQSFKITYIRTDWSGRCYTIQTADGRYLALDGMAINGSPLITRSEPYYLYISNGQMAYVSSTENRAQCLNACGQQKEDGTPIISWDLTSTYNTGNLNYKFIFEFAK
ncbi:MAG: hypothetical protein RR787_01675 [Hydrogenoanaerobacterium sp.]